MPCTVDWVYSFLVIHFVSLPGGNCPNSQLCWSGLCGSCFKACLCHWRIARAPSFGRWGLLVRRCPPHVAPAAPMRRHVLDEAYGLQVAPPMAGFRTCCISGLRPRRHALAPVPNMFACPPWGGPACNTCAGLELRVAQVGQAHHATGAHGSARNSEQTMSPRLCVNDTICFGATATQATPQMVGFGTAISLQFTIEASGCACTSLCGDPLSHCAALLVQTPRAPLRFSRRHGQACCTQRPRREAPQGFLGVREACVG